MGRVSASPPAAHGGPPRVSVRTDLGRVRAVNEDSVLARYPLYLVADGMGGHERGDVASRRAIEVIDAAIAADAPTTSAELVAAVHAANAAVHQLGSEAMSGTTLTGMAITATETGEVVHWTVVNVCDSRVYRWNGRALTQLTVDHSVVQELIEAGVITAVDAEHHPDRNTITRAIGAFPTVEIDVWLLPYAGGQTFLICSDGLTKELPLERMEHILAAHPAADGPTIADALVEAALASGGRDNISAIVIETDGGEDELLAGTGTRERPRELEDTLPRGIA
jgi:PPM family protein phosphatase